MLNCWLAPTSSRVDGRNAQRVRKRKKSGIERATRPEAGHGGVTRNPDRPIDLNSASQKELGSLPGVGPVIARRIVESRPYRSVDDLQRVKGIGARHLAEIRALAIAR